MSAYDLKICEVSFVSKLILICKAYTGQRRVKGKITNKEFNKNEIGFLYIAFFFPSSPCVYPT